MKTHTKSGGFIKAIILIIIAIAILSYYEINLKDIWLFIVKIWDLLLATPVKFVWHLWVDYIWQPFLNSVDSLNN